MWTFFTHCRFFGKRFFLKKSRGFTIVELLVVLAIVTLLSGVFVFQQRRFDSSTLLRSLAYSIALSVRQAQVYGTSVRQFGTTPGSFNYNYGLYFSNGAQYYYLFADVDGDNQRNSNGSEDVQRFTIGKGYTLLQFCATPSSGSAMCSPAIGSLVIYFKRPNPDACFATVSTDTCNTYKDAYVRIDGPASGSSDTRRITVTATGQISVGAFGS